MRPRIHFTSSLLSPHPGVSVTLQSREMSTTENHLKTLVLLPRTTDTYYQSQLANRKTERDSGSWDQSSVVLCLHVWVLGSHHKSQGKEMRRYLAIEKWHMKRSKEGNQGPGKTFQNVKTPEAIKFCKDTKEMAFMHCFHWVWNFLNPWSTQWRKWQESVKMTLKVTPHSVETLPKKCHKGKLYNTIYTNLNILKTL